MILRAAHLFGFKWVHRVVATPLTIMPRDDLSIDWNRRALTPRTAYDPNMPQIEHQDAAAVLDEWTNRAANLPNEIAFMQDEITEKDRQMQECLEIITKNDNAIQKFIRANGSHVPNPKEESLSKAVFEAYDRATILQEEKLALAKKTQIITDKHTRWLDLNLKVLQDRGEIQPDPELPSILRPPQPERPPRLETNIPNNNMPLGQISNSATPRHANQHPPRALPGHVQTHPMSGLSSSSAPATPSASLMMHQRARESSLGAAAVANKRQRTGGIGGLPSSGLARQSSMTPGTPRGGTPTVGRAASVGPRASQKSVPPKMQPHQKNRQNPKKSGLSRVKRSGNKNSPSTNDSELSDADTGTGDDEDETISTKKEDVDGDALMGEPEDDERDDDKKYCVCQNVSFGDMVACDNDNCPMEWFHWNCVGLKSEPKGQWICPPCSKVLKETGHLPGQQ
jgi:inhibitor of growth protein 3